MAIKMRTNREDDVQCCDCGNGRSASLDMFDVCIGGQIFTLCDICNERLLQKTLKAACSVNHKIKQKSEMEIIRKRQVCKHV